MWAEVQRHFLVWDLRDWDIPSIPSSAFIRPVSFDCANDANPLGSKKRVGTWMPEWLCGTELPCQPAWLILELLWEGEIKFFIVLSHWFFEVSYYSNIALPHNITNIYYIPKMFQALEMWQWTEQGGFCSHGAHSPVGGKQTVKISVII